MKTKRTGLLVKVNQGAKKNQKATSNGVSAAKLHEEKKQDKDCNGACSLSWKPQAVAR